MQKMAVGAAVHCDTATQRLLDSLVAEGTCASLHSPWVLCPVMGRSTTSCIYCSISYQVISIYLLPDHHLLSQIPLSSFCFSSLIGQMMILCHVQYSPLLLLSSRRVVHCGMAGVRWLLTCISLAFIFCLSNIKPSKRSMCFVALMKGYTIQ